MKSDYRGKPELWQTPQRLSIEPRGVAAGKLRVFRGVHFLSPWGEDQVVKEFESGGLLKFGDSRSLLFFGIRRIPPNFRTIASVGNSRDWLSSVMGGAAMRSNFDMEEEILKTTPRDLKFSLDRRRMARAVMFESVKQSEASNGETGIYEFETGRVRGFQKGNPEKSETVVLDVYDSNDRLTTIIVATLKNAPTHLTQVEVNTLIGSLDVEQDSLVQPTALK